ncbi:ABC transporter permease [Actinotalea sp. K2]|uniref:ABC transporter permease n=1 Tax=Actinotalea sp. K2 TaxID=2939438 RepID=UPI0020181874|nr:ABC transporter permease [Actinotalea sp. K2]MCL3859615.1 ABC transporter permease [Actinotalea sp. K2]
MNRRVSRPAIVASIVRKDFTEFSRDLLYIFLSVLGLVLFAVTYYLVPDTVDETLTVGVHQTGLDELFDQLDASEADGLALVQYAGGDELAAAVHDGDVMVGLAFPEGFLEAATAGEQPTVTVYSDAAVPPEVTGAVQSMVREIAYALTGHGLPVTEPAEESIVLGIDRAGDQTSMRDLMLPMLVFFILMIETFALSSLIANEVLNRTVTAVLVTPARVSDFLTAKTIYGTLLTGGQAVLLLLVLQAFTLGNLGILLATVLLGAVMFTGIGMIAGSAGKDFFSTLFLTMAFVLPLMIPTFSVLFPGTAAGWVQAMPSYPIIDTLNEVLTYGAGWSDVVGSLGAALAWVTVIFVIGLLVLRRKVRSL